MGKEADSSFTASLMHFHFQQASPGSQAMCETVLRSSSWIRRAALAVLPEIKGLTRLWIPRLCFKLRGFLKESVSHASALLRRALLFKGLEPLMVKLPHESASFWKMAMMLPCHGRSAGSASIARSSGVQACRRREDSQEPIQNLKNSRILVARTPGLSYEGAPKILKNGPSWAEEALIVVGMLGDLIWGSDLRSRFDLMFHPTSILREPKP